MKDQWFVKRLFWKFFTSSLLCSLSMAGISLVNSLYIGNTLGEDGLFILGAAAPVYMIYSMISVGIAGGGTTHYATALSQGNEREGNRIFFSVVAVNLILVLLVSAVGLLFLDRVLQLLGCPKDSPHFPAMRSHVSLIFLVAPIQFMQAPLCNFVHSTAPNKAAFSLIAGFSVTCIAGLFLIVLGNAGVNGSVWAAVLGALVMEGICVVFLLTGNDAIRKAAKPSLRLAAKSFFTGFASGADYIYQFIVVLSFNRILLAISGTDGVAIFGMVESVNALVIFAVDAITVAMTPLICTFFGEHNKNGMLGCLKLSMVTGLVCTAAMSACMALFAGSYCTFSGLDGQTLENGVTALRTVMLCAVFNAANMVLTAYFQNTGAEKRAYLIVLLRGILLLLPSGFLLSLKGFNTFWWCYAITEGFSLIVSIAMLALSMKKKSNAAELEEMKVFSETFVGTCGEISDTCQRIQEFLEENGASIKKAYFVTLAVDETCRLIAENADELMLQLTLTMDADGYVLHIRDNAANRFNPFEIQEDNDRGLGLKLVKKQAQDFYFREFVGYNTLTVIFGGD